MIPVAMIGTDKVQPIGRTIPHLGRVGIVLGEPLDFSRYEGMEGDRFVLRSITDEIMYALMELSGQEYVDVYAATMKERLASAKRTKPRPVATAVAAASAMTAAASERVKAVTDAHAHGHAEAERTGHDDADQVEAGQDDAGQDDAGQDDAEGGPAQVGRSA